MAGLFDVPLLQDEPLTSYLARLARANGAGTTRGFCQDMKLDRPRLIRGDEAEVRKLAVLAGRDAEELQARAVVVDDFSGATVAGHYFPHGKLRRSKLRFCPRCIADDDADGSRMPGTRRYSRLHWMFPQVPACHVHCVAIVETEADQSHHYDLNTQLDLLGDRMYEFMEARVPRRPTPFEEFVRERLSGRRAHGEFLDGFGLSAGMSACELLGVGLLFGREVLVGKLGEEDLHRARQAGFERLVTGNGGFTSLLDDIRSTDERSNIRGGQALYGKLYLSLNENYEDPDYDRLRTMMRKHTLSRIPMLDGMEFFGPITESPWTSIGKIAEATGYPDETLRRILVELGHIGSLRQSKGDRYVRKTAADEAVAAIRDMATREETAAILGLPSRTVKRLISDGMIAPVLKSADAGERGYRLLDRYSRRAVADLRDRLLARARPEFPTEWTNLTMAARKAGLRLVDVLEMVLDGRLRNLGKSPNEDGVASLRFDVREIESLIAVTGEVYVERSEVCRRLLLKAEAFAFLVRTGDIKAEQRQLRVARAPTWVMTEADFKEFDARYVTFSRLSKEIRVGSRGLGKILAERGASLAFPMESVKQGIVERRHLSA
ncbi:TniQ family protein [Rhizobium sp. CNPSo 3490]|uniref:TniQ family protein n=1 Tax=Rhizobium sp. CNPSo 3490 TaxID=3021407 RepID=UPI00254C3FDE|nr:TniQ family protein [Rhizobium sp. CNPSo 3490]MDK4733961.1 TniQ family protein [Rhizobium sp. CNPSo 3490]